MKERDTCEVTVTQGRFERWAYVKTGMNTRIPYKVFQIVLLVGIGLEHRVGAVQSAQRLDTGWTVRGSNPGGGEIFRTYPDRLPGTTQPPVQWLPNIFPWGKAVGP